MSWQTITKDGQKMYESCDGEILSSTEDIYALENHRKNQYKQIRERQLEKHLFFENNKLDEKIEPLSKTESIVYLAVLILFVGYCILQNFI